MAKTSSWRHMPKDRRLFHFPLGADLARVLVLRELGEPCQFLEGELLELGHGGVSRRRRRQAAS